jgi:hypothetical protein
MQQIYNICIFYLFLVSIISIVGYKSLSKNKELFSYEFFDDSDIVINFQEYMMNENNEFDENIQFDQLLTKLHTVNRKISNFETENPDVYVKEDRDKINKMKDFLIITHTKLQNIYDQFNTLEEPEKTMYLTKHFNDKDFQDTVNLCTLLQDDVSFKDYELKHFPFDFTATDFDDLIHNIDMHIQNKEVDIMPVDEPMDIMPVYDGPVDDGPVDDGPVDDGPVDDGPVDDGPVDDGCSSCYLTNTNYVEWAQFQSCIEKQCYQDQPSSSNPYQPSSSNPYQPFSSNPSIPYYEDQQYADTGILVENKNFHIKLKENSILTGPLFFTPKYVYLSDDELNNIDTVLEKLIINNVLDDNTNIGLSLAKNNRFYFIARIPERSKYPRNADLYNFVRDNSKFDTYIKEMKSIQIYK